MQSYETSNGAMPHALAQALHTARDAYIQHHPKSQAATEVCSRYMPGGNTRTSLYASPFALTFEGGKGAVLTTIDGHAYTDFLGEYSAGIYGHDHPTIRAAIEQALAKGWNLGGYSPYEQQLARMVCERFQPTLELVRFTNSGTEANMCAVATAMAVTARKKILVFEGAYHGSTLGFPVGAPHDPMNLPHEWVVGAYDDIEQTRSIVEALPPDSLAAVLVEPMQGNNRARTCDPAFLHFLRDMTRRLGSLLIFDEVQTSRLSYHGFGHKLGIQPDLMTLGKWVGGGMSFGAFGGRKDIMELFHPQTGRLRHAGTFNNNVVSMSAGCAGLDILTPKVVEDLNAKGERMKSLLEDLLASHGLGKEKSHNADAESASKLRLSPLIYVSGAGSILFMGFSGHNRDTLQALFYHHMLEQNIYLASRGFMALSLQITQEHVEIFVAAVDTFLQRFKHLLTDVHG